MLQAASADCDAVVRLSTGDLRVHALALGGHQKACIGDFEVWSAGDLGLVIHQSEYAHCACCQRMTG